MREELVAVGDTTVRLAAVDDHPVLLAGIRAQLPVLEPSIDFVRDAPTVADLLATDEAYDVVLLDLRLGDASRPADNVVELVAAGVRVLVYTEGRTPAPLLEALTAGAHGVLRKDRPTATLVEAVLTVAAGEQYVNEELAQVLDAALALRPALSEREREVLTLYAAGLQAKNVARRLGVSVETIKEYLKRIRAKYAELERPAISQMELYHRAVEDGLIEP